MSRIGKLPVVIPAGVTVTFAEGNTVTVKGPKGTLTRTFVGPFTFENENNHIVVVCPENPTKKVHALHGLTRVLLNNMVIGVSKGYEKSLLVEGVGYKAVAKGNKVGFSVGYSHEVEVTPPEGIKIDVISAGEVKVSGIDKELVGQVAADIRAIKVPDPYHIYGIRYKDEVIVKKEGKAAGK